MKLTSLKCCLLAAAIILCTPIALSQDAHTQLVILGTGTPIINPDRSGPSVAVVVKAPLISLTLAPEWCVAPLLPPETSPLPRLRQRI